MKTFSFFSQKYILGNRETYKIPKDGKLEGSESDTGRELNSKYINHMDRRPYLKFRLSRKQDFVEEVKYFFKYQKNSYLGEL